MDTLEKKWFMFMAGLSEIAGNVMMLLRIASSFKFRDYFWNFPDNIFEL